MNKHCNKVTNTNIHSAIKVKALGMRLYTSDYHYY